MYFCIRDDDTSYFTSPDQLESAYGEIKKWGPVSLAVVPFHRAGTSRGVPEKHRGKWSVHPLHENQPLVGYLQAGVAAGHFEIMLHGYHHDEVDGRPEFKSGGNFASRIADGRKYLEDLLGAAIRVFIPPHNSIDLHGLRALANEGLNLGGVAGMRKGWPVHSIKTWKLWLRLRGWERQGGEGIPWILDLGDHREMAGTPITPSAYFEENIAAFDCALKIGGVFCAATHYWEFAHPSVHLGDPSVGEHLRQLIARARSNHHVIWRSVGDILAGSAAVV